MTNLKSPLSITAVGKKQTSNTTWKSKNKTGKRPKTNTSEQISWSKITSQTKTAMVMILIEFQRWLYSTIVCQSFIINNRIKPIKQSSWLNKVTRLSSHHLQRNLQWGLRISSQLSIPFNPKYLKRFFSSNSAKNTLRSAKQGSDKLFNSLKRNSMTTAVMNKL